MRKVDYNIEFAHIYADEILGEEQIRSIKILKQVIKKLNKQNKKYVLSILVDDYHSTNSQININKLIQEIKSFGIDVDFIGFESKLIKYADSLIKRIPRNKLSVELFDAPQKKVLMLNHHKKIGLRESQAFAVRHTCAVLSAVWTLSRLGIYRLNKNQLKSISNKPFVADNIITILPKKYKPVEDKVIKIIEASNFNNLLSRINYKFY